MMGVVGCGEGVVYHRGVQLILAYSWARPAILVARKGRGGMFLFSSVSSLSFLFLFLPCPSLSSPVLSLLSLFSSARQGLIFHSFDIFILGKSGLGFLKFSTIFHRGRGCKTLNHHHLPWVYSVWKIPEIIFSINIRHFFTPWHTSRKIWNGSQLQHGRRLLDYSGNYFSLARCLILQ